MNPIKPIGMMIIALALAITPAADGAAQSPFPLVAAPDGRHLVDAAGRPFFIHGDAAWSLIAQLRREDVDFYFSDRRARGFNAILVSLIEHKYASHPPRNAYGTEPFLNPGDFLAPNEAYFAHADWVLRRAAEEGFLVLLTPAYAGFKGGDAGWYREMRAAGPGRLRLYGEYLGRRYASFPNILWVNGGDYDPPQEALVRALAEGIRANAPTALQTLHGSPGFASLDKWAHEEWLQVNAVYTYGSIARTMAEQQRQPRKMPSLLIESAYENEQDSTPAQLRSQAYQALVMGAAGHVFGNNPIWHFDGPGIYDTSLTWKQALDSPGARSMGHLAALTKEIDWWHLRPCETGWLLVEGGGLHLSKAVAAMNEDRTFALVYVPGRQRLVINLNRFSGSTITGRWYDPTSGRFMPVADSPFPANGYRPFRANPPANASGDDDWVLLLNSQPY
ncbi:MAG: DUF4038 domain-containing protein [Rhodospirillales bacterium]|nr:DUF4038 domain-containing protein [Rhodospirillales bacterium]